MKKIIFVSILILFVFATVVSAQEVYGGDDADTGLSAKDIRAFINNYYKIDYLLDDFDFDDLAYMSESQYKDYNSQLNQLGITGDDQLHKIFVIAIGYSIMDFNNYLNLNPAMVDYFNNIGFDPLAKLRELVSPDDYSVLINFYDQLRNVFGSEYDDFDDFDDILDELDELDDVGDIDL